VCRHLRSAGIIYSKYIVVPYDLSAEQRQKRVEAAITLLSALEKQQKVNFRDIVTLDETPVTLENEEKAGWHLEDNPTPRVQAVTLRKVKFTLTVVWGACGIIVVDGCNGENRINSNYFIGRILKPTSEWCNNKRPRTGVSSFIFHMDNAPCHNSGDVSNYMNNNKMNRIRHPPYSPDLAPCDFFLFGYMKQHIAGTVFKDMEDATAQITQWLVNIPKETHIAVMHEWMTRLQKCIDLKGDYVFLPHEVAAEEERGESNSSASKTVSE